MKFIELNLPFFPFRIKQENEQYFIFDEIRKKTIRLTPEEWVRQHFIQFLINDRKYPKTFISIEKGLSLNDLKKRSDILVFNRDMRTHLLVECKAPSVKISQDVFDQAARYNMIYKVKYLAVTNGMQHYYCEMDYETQSYRFIEEIPLFDQ